MLKSSLTAADLWPPVLHCDIAEVATDPSIGLQELALETIYCRVFAQSARAGSNKGLWVDVLVANSEGSLLQDITPIQVKMWQEGLSIKVSETQVY